MGCCYCGYRNQRVPHLICGSPIETNFTQLFGNPRSRSKTFRKSTGPGHSGNLRLKTFTCPTRWQVSPTSSLGSHRSSNSFDSLRWFLIPHTIPPAFGLCILLEEPRRDLGLTSHSHPLVSTILLPYYHPTTASSSSSCCYVATTRRTHVTPPCIQT